MRALVLVALVACGGPRFHPVEPAPRAPLAIERITLTWSNVYLVTHDGAALLIDSGSPVDREALADALAARNVHPRAVVVTHAHADHAGCARWLQTQGAAIVLGAGDAPVAARGRNDRLQPTSLSAALLASIFMFPFDPFTPDVAVDHEIDLAAYGFPELRVVPVAGHTPGSIAVLAGDAAFIGDMLKGGELFTHDPTEHLYQTDRLADHRAITALLAGDVQRLYPGHSGPLAAADVTGWLAGADTPPGDNAVSIELDARGELSRDGGISQGAATAGARVRYVFGRGIGYMVGGDLRAGYLDGGIYELDAHPLGLALRDRDGALLGLSVGGGIGGVRGVDATHAVLELSGEHAAGPVRLFGRVALGWRTSGPQYDGEFRSFADELVVQAGVRLGRDERWGEYVAGKGPHLAVVYRNLGGTVLYGIALGVELFAGR